MWILPKNHPLYSVYAQDFSLDLTEDLKQLWEESSEPLLMWKSKPLSWKILLRAWKRVYWMRYLCGRILKPSLGRSFEERWIGSLEDTHANHLVMPETGGGADDPRHLYPFISEGIRAIRPMGCFFENVSGHLTLGYDIVRRDLQSMGYRVEEGIFSAEEVGASHRRERLFILALLGDSESNDQWNDIFKTGHRKVEIGRTSSELVHPSNYKWRLLQSTKRNKNIEIGRTSKTMADSNECRSSQNIILPKRFSSIGDRQPSRITQWPSGPGQEQYDWEEPRTIESGLGCTINGYNFREDLLRGLGNGVVWQTAELAFRTLLKKHNNHYGNNR